MEDKFDGKMIQNVIDNSTLSTNENDEQYNENFNNFNNDEKLSEDDEDELTRKIRAIPILPRIPKLKKAESSGDIKKQTLEHRSILHRKDSIINPDQSLKWPTSESFGGTGLNRNNNSRRFSHTSQTNKQFNNFIKNNNYVNNNKNKCINNSHKNQNDKQPTHLTYSSFKRSKQGLDSIDDSSKKLTSEEKFDQIFNKKEPINNSEPVNNVDNKIICKENNVKNDATDDFDSFENNILNIIAKTPCKTIEDRFRERIQMGLITAQVNTEPSCSKTDLLNSQIVNKIEKLTNNDNFNKQISQVHRNNSNSSISINGNNNSDGPTNSDSVTNVVDMDLDDSSDENKSTNNKDKFNSNDKNSNISRKVTFNCPDTNDNPVATKNKKPMKKKKNIEAMNNDKSSKSSASQEKVVLIMKDFLKPYYSKQKISKDEYKEIMRKSVPKFSHMKCEEIKVDKIHNYAMKLLKLSLNSKNRQDNKSK